MDAVGRVVEAAQRGVELDRRFGGVWWIHRRVVKYPPVFVHIHRPCRESFMPIVTVPQHSVAIVQRFGKHHAVTHAGLSSKVYFIDTVVDRLAHP